MTLSNKLLLALGALGLAGFAIPAQAGGWGIRFGYHSGVRCGTSSHAYVCYGSPRYPSCQRVVIHDRAPDYRVRRACTPTYRGSRRYVTHRRVRHACAPRRTAVYRTYAAPRVVHTRRVYTTRRCEPRYERSYRTYRSYRSAPRMHRRPSSIYRHHHGRPQVRVRYRCGG